MWWGAVDESAGPSAVPANPLADDLVLFNMYMTAVEAVLADPEITGTLKELEFSPRTLHMAMTGTADEVLRGAPAELAAYAVAREHPAPDAGAAGLSTRSRFAGVSGTAAYLTFLGASLAALGLLGVVIGAASFAAWTWTQWLLWAGLTLLFAGVPTFGFGWVSGREWFMLLQGTPPPGHPVLAEARENLMAAVPHEQYVAHARALIAAWREAGFSHLYSVTSISGLSETYDSTYQVDTAIASDLEGLLSRVDGASIGVAGPRGVGKSTLIRGYCDDDSGQGACDDLCCMVSAPVDYNSQEFVLHLFAVFCRAVIRRYDAAPGHSLAGAAVWLLRPTRTRVRRLLSGVWAVAFVAALLHWQQPVAIMIDRPAAWVFYAAIAIAGLELAQVVRATARLTWRRADDGGLNGPRLVAAAREHLTRVRYLQTYTSGWSGTLGLPKGGSGQFSRGLARAEQKPTYPEAVGDFQGFARRVAAHLHTDGGRIFIGIDELDKIGTPDQAEKFLNAIKAIFGIPHVYFMVSVSDEALAAFERRGLPLRDTFDSSFDEIIHAGTLTYTETRRLLNRRVAGLTEPYVALCHCLAGGLARDIIRAARQVVRASEAIAGTAVAPDAPVDSTAAFVLLQEGRTYQQTTISAVCRELVREELRRKNRAVAQAASNIAAGQAQALLDCLQNAVRGISRNEPALKIVDVVSRAAAEPPSVAALRCDFAAYAYYCAALQDVFTDHLDAAQMFRATSAGDDPGTFDALAAARHAFALDTQLAWQAVSRFREAWGLSTLSWPGLSGAPSAAT
jgi:hypothetical protein